MKDVEVDIRLGRKTGEFFLSHLIGATQRLWVMSPWISSEYMELLLSKKAAGVDVRVFTSNDFIPEQKKALSSLIEGRKRILKEENKTLRYWGIGLIVGGVVLSVFTVGLTLLLSLVGLVMFLVGRERSEIYWVSLLGDENLKVFESSQYSLMHSKVYVADSTVVIGSANFTGNGLQRSFEGMATMQSAELAEQVCKQITEAPLVSSLKEVSYDVIAEVIQEEAPRKHYYRRRRW